MNNYYSHIMYQQGVSVAKGQEQKQIVVVYSRWIHTSD